MSGALLLRLSCSLCAVLTALFVVLALVISPVAQTGASRSGAVNLRITLAQLGSKPGVPAPPIRVVLRRLDGSAQPLRIQVGRSGEAQATVPPGRYEFTTEQPVSSEGKWYMWNLEVPITEPTNEVALGEWNAIVLNNPPDALAKGAEAETGAAVRAPRQTAASKNAPPVPVPELIPKPSPIRRAKVPPNPRVEIIREESSNAPPVKIIREEPPAPPVKIIREEDDPEPEPTRASVPRIAPAPPARTRTQSSSDEQSEAEIRELLNRWVLAVKERDVDSLVSCYAPQLTRYFRMNNVSRRDVRRDKEDFFRRYPSIRRLDLADVQIEANGDTGQATLRKAWDFGGPISFAGEVAARLSFRKVDGEWVISAERERLLWEKKVAMEARAEP